jgi:hypothetical protein
MHEQGEEMTQEELKKKAYLVGLRLRSSGLDSEAIYARLEKEGIPEEMAKDVVRDIMIERKREVVKEATPIYNFALVRIGIGVAVALISYLATDNVLLPIGIILAGVVTALLMKRKMEG